MHERVEAVHGAGHPGDEEGAEEEEGDAGVEPGCGVRFAEQGRVAGEGADVEELGGGGGVAGVGGGGRRGFHVDGVWVEGGCCGGGVEGGGCGGGDCGGGGFCGGGGGGGVQGWFAAGVGRDVYFGGDGAFEGVLVEGVEEAAELVSVVPDFAEGEQVDCQGEDECEPRL